MTFEQYFWKTPFLSKPKTRLLGCKKQTKMEKNTKLLHDFFDDFISIQRTVLHMIKNTIIQNTRYMLPSAKGLVLVQSGVLTKSHTKGYIPHNGYICHNDQPIYSLRMINKPIIVMIPRSVVCADNCSRSCNSNCSRTGKSSVQNKTQKRKSTNHQLFKDNLFTF